MLMILNITAKQEILFNCKKYHQNKNLILNLIQNATPDEKTISASDTYTWWFCHFKMSCIIPYEPVTLSPQCWWVMVGICWPNLWDYSLNIDNIQWLVIDGMGGMEGLHDERKRYWHSHMTEMRTWWCGIRGMLLYHTWYETEVLCSELDIIILKRLVCSCRMLNIMAHSLSVYK